MQSNRLLLAIPILAVLSATAIANFKTPDNILEMTQFRDRHNRTFIPQGYVVNTHVRGEKVEYSLADYQRMTRYGANFQVIRISLRRLGGWPGHKLQNDYLKQIDSMIKNANAVGIKTCFKMVVYDIPDFKKIDGWSLIWHNTNDTHQHIISAWQAIWTRYKDDPNVIAYDLLNEPMLGDVKDFQTLERDYLVPLYRKLIDELHKISPQKYACYQPIHTEPKEDCFSPFADMTVPINRSNIIFAAHIYEYEPHEISDRLDNYAEQANLSNAKLILGEWGPAIFRHWDHTTRDQQFIARVYDRSCKEIDLRSIATVKAWFIGTLGWGDSSNPATWAIFRDKKHMGTVERKYILDYICRPRPLYVAGRTKTFSHNFQTRTFEMSYTPQKTTAPTELYIPANRHYPDGFTVLVNDEAVFNLALDIDTPSHLKPTLTDAAKNFGNIEWQSWPQKLIIDDSHLIDKLLILKIAPGRFL